MKKRIKDVLIGFIIGSLLMTTTPALADSILQKIDVALNVVNVEVNGDELNSNSILYDGSTYLPLRKVAEAVGKEVEWNQTTMTANIIEKEEESDVNKMIIYNENGYWFGKKENITYYSSNYIYNLISEYGEFSWQLDSEVNPNKITLIKNADSILDNIEFEFIQNRIFISKDYYENTILPLIK